MMVHIILWYGGVCIIIDTETQKNSKLGWLSRHAYLIDNIRAKRSAHTDNNHHKHDFRLIFYPVLPRTTTLLVVAICNLSLVLCSVSSL